MGRQDIEPVFRIAWVMIRIEYFRMQGVHIDEFGHSLRERAYRAYLRSVDELDLSDDGSLRRASEEAKRCIREELEAMTAGAK
jgi:hypothetical protein